MEEILKQLYHQKYQSLQKKRTDKLNDPQPQNHRRAKNYALREDSYARTPSTQFTFDDQIRFQKEFAEIREREYKKQEALSNRYKEFEFPPISKSKQAKAKPVKIRRKLLTRFKKSVLAVIFLIRLRKNIKRALLAQQAKIEESSSRLIDIIKKLVHGYYYQLLDEQMAIYLNILENSQPDQKRVARMLLEMSRKLAESTVTKEILQFFVLISGSNSILPGDYLSAMEINRLEFSQIYGSIIDVTPEQSRMIIGLGLGIKIFCLYILYRPYQHPQASPTLVQNLSKVRDTISNVGSVFYFMLLEQFCFSLKEIRSVSRECLQSFGIRAIDEISPFSDRRGQPSSKHLIAGQNRLFLNSLEYRQPEMMDEIRSNLKKWINRISYACLKEIKRRSEKKRVVRKGNKARLYRSLESREGEPLVQRRPASRARAIHL